MMAINHLNIMMGNDIILPRSAKLRDWNSVEHLCATQPIPLIDVPIGETSRFPVNHDWDTLDTLCPTVVPNPPIFLPPDAVWGYRPIGIRLWDLAGMRRSRFLLRDSRPPVVRSLAEHFRVDGR
jgi:hypothetical protein